MRPLNVPFEPPINPPDDHRPSEADWHASVAALVGVRSALEETLPKELAPVREMLVYAESIIQDYLDANH